MAALPQSVRRRFEAVMFDWDGTAVPDRAADAGAVSSAVETACSLGLEVAVVSGTSVGNIDGQLAARPTGPGDLHLLLNRGSEVFTVGAAGPELTERRTATADEQRALDRAAALTIERLRERGLEARVISERLNRRKIDLIPLAEWEDPPKARIAELLGAVERRLREHRINGLAGAVELAEIAALAAGLAGARVTSDAKHVELGLTDKADSARWYAELLWRRGIWPEQVLIVGDELGPLGGLTGSDAMLMVERVAAATVVSVGAEPAGVPDGVIALGGGPPRFLALLREQIRLRQHGALPMVPSDPTWTLRVEGVSAAHERAYEALLTVADGRLGTRGSMLVPSRASRPGVVMAGAYSGRGERSELRRAPLWNRLAADAPDDRATRTLDLHAGLLAHQTQTGSGALQFSSLADPGVAVLCAIGPREELDRSQPPLALPRARSDSQEDGGPLRIPVAAGVLEAAGAQSVHGSGETASLTRIAAYVLTSDTDRDRPAARRLHGAQDSGHERLLTEHRRAWAERWEQSDVRVEGDPELQQAVRIGLYHLMGSTADSGEAALGARGLSGPGYRGHVFWDSDVFALPFLAATHSASARALLEYRVRCLPAAQAAARTLGYRGARFAWESAASGEDVTPRVVRDGAGREVEIHTGQREEHIVADVAWGAACYVDWTGDQQFRTGPGRRLLVETARYWASRVERDDDGTAHIRGVIGPDEYHEVVDDNAYTNVMARWNLRRAFAETTGDGEVDHRERASWMELAEALVDGYQADTGLYEQFAGFFELEPLVIAQLAPQRPIAADQLLGDARVHGAQVVKQADVLMLHQLVPDELAPGSLPPNLDFYEPRTAHGSSLSPGIHAALFARANRLAEAQAALRMAARIDLDDSFASTGAGVHIAAMGSVWQALTYGFAGVRPGREALEIDPHLPADWKLLELRLSFRGAKLRVRVSAEEVDVTADRPARVSIAGADPITIGGRGRRSGLSRPSRRNEAAVAAGRPTMVLAPKTKGTDR
ncbi:MAG: glycosyl hydrolase family 65 protein [Solirubrobacteraceae bacterium]